MQALGLVRISKNTKSNVPKTEGALDMGRGFLSLYKDIYIPGND